MKKGRSLQIINRDLKSLINNTRFIKWDGRIRRIKNRRIRGQATFLYCEGVKPVACLKILLKADFELKPHSKAMPNKE